MTGKGGQGSARRGWAHPTSVQRPAPRGSPMGIAKLAARNRGDPNVGSREIWVHVKIPTTWHRSPHAMASWSSSPGIAILVAWHRTAIRWVAWATRWHRVAIALPREANDWPCDGHV